MLGAKLGKKGEGCPIVHEKLVIFNSCVSRQSVLFRKFARQSRQLTMNCKFIIAN